MHDAMHCHLNRWPQQQETDHGGQFDPAERFRDRPSEGHRYQKWADTKNGAACQIGEQQRLKASFAPGLWLHSAYSFLSIDSGLLDAPRRELN
jgi:hypothetical protein